MAQETIEVTAAGYTASMDVPTKQQLEDAQAYSLMLTIAAEQFQIKARSDRDDEVTAIAALQLAINAARDAAIPALQLTPEE